jgi:rRNA maturation RNase YbeY
MIEFNYQAGFKLSNESSYAEWCRQIIDSEDFTFKSVQYIFCTDEFLLDINQEFLKHDTYTDIITFDYGVDDLIEGEIYISVDRLKDNAMAYNVTFDEELLRVMAHGILHLCGYPDKSEEEERIMRIKELEKMKMFHVKQ